METAGSKQEGARGLEFALFDHSSCSEALLQMGTLGLRVQMSEVRDFSWFVPLRCFQGFRFF